jgi:hypothetical protein
MSSKVDPTNQRLSYQDQEIAHDRAKRMVLQRRQKSISIGLEEHTKVTTP